MLARALQFLGLKQKEYYNNFHFRSRCKITTKSYQKYIKYEVISLKNEENDFLKSEKREVDSDKQF